MSQASLPRDDGGSLAGDRAFAVVLARLMASTWRQTTKISKLATFSYVKLGPAGPNFPYSSPRTNKVRDGLHEINAFYQGLVVGAPGLEPGTR